MRDPRPSGTLLRAKPESPLSLCYHVYPGSVSDAAELPAVLPEIVRWEWRIEAGHGRLQFDVDQWGPSRSSRHGSGAPS